MSAGLTPRQELFRAFYEDRVLAHRTLFAHRHTNAAPDFHEAMILDWHSDEQYVCELAFRGSAKSTLAEEAIVLLALFGEFRNCIIFGASATLAEQRLHAIRREFERNQVLRQVFGEVRGQPWGDDKIELTNGVVVRAMGRGQALRGTKEEVERPDLVFADDIEDEQSVSSPKGRDKVQKWFLGEVIPAMADPTVRKVRIAANALDPECLAMKLKDPKSGFRVRVTPWVYFDEKGEPQSSWPSRYPLPFINAERAKMYALGRGDEYEKEYMCEPLAPEARPFHETMFVIEPQVRTWQAVYSMTDPARTKGVKSADTGHAVWSWVGPRLIVWDAWSRQLMPDQIITSLFETNERYSPVYVGVEEDGLNEFLLQPIRTAQVERGVSLPLKSLRAPRGKLDFIKSLQPYFKAREVVFAQRFADLMQQLVGFPTGRIDCPNALAYALKMRPGAPIYDDFKGIRHAAEDLAPAWGKPVWLCLNATRSCVTGIVAQIIDGQIRVFADFVREGEPGAVARDIVSEANLIAGRPVKAVAGPLHFDRFNNVGLVQALKTIPTDVTAGVEPMRGRDHLRSLLQRERQGSPMFLTAHAARWTLNGLAGGYARSLNKQGVLSDLAEPGVYQTLIEGLESWAGLLALGSTGESDSATHNSVTRDGRAYTSILGARR